MDIAAIAEQLQAVQAIAKQFHPSDCYNCDETGLFFKMVPDRGLSTQRVPGQKVEKARVTAHFCCNADGSYKLPIWFIGKAAKPRCFGAASIHFSAFNCIWKYNGKAWMTTEIMVEWLYWFSSIIGTRKVLLIMDNFSAYTAAVNLIKESRPLQNVTIVWLPPCSTSYYQPLDQGIIKAFKASYRRKWLAYMLDEFEANRYPLKTMNVLKAIKWSIQAWQAIQSTAIQHCWYHSTIIQRPEGLLALNPSLSTDETAVAAVIE